MEYEVKRVSCPSYNGIEAIIPEYDIIASNINVTYSRTTNQTRWFRQGAVDISNFNVGDLTVETMNNDLVELWKKIYKIKQSIYGIQYDKLTVEEMEEVLSVCDAGMNFSSFKYYIDDEEVLSINGTNPYFDETKIKPMLIIPIIGGCLLIYIGVSLGIAEIAYQSDANRYTGFLETDDSNIFRVFYLKDGEPLENKVIVTNYTQSFFGSFAMTDNKYTIRLFLSANNQLLWFGNYFANTDTQSKASNYPITFNKDGINNISSIPSAMSILQNTLLPEGFDYEHMMLLNTDYIVTPVPPTGDKYPNLKLAILNDSFDFE